MDDVPPSISPVAENHQREPSVNWYSEQPGYPGATKQAGESPVNIDMLTLSLLLFLLLWC